MTNLPTSPLQSLLQKAATSLPAETGTTARFRERLDSAGSSVVLVCDTSGSMAESAGGRTKYDHLQEAVDSLKQSIPDAVIVSFNSFASVVYGPLPMPSGGTALDIALDEAARHSPRKTIVVSDGEPNDPNKALEAARRVPGTIDVIYCGSDTNLKAIEFMRRLAREGAGSMVVHDLVKLNRPQLAAEVRRLALPAHNG